MVQALIYLYETVFFKKSFTPKYIQNHELLVVGGRNENQTLLSTTESFAGSSGTWTSLDNITEGKYGHCQVDSPDFRIMTVSLNQ